MNPFAKHDKRAHFDTNLSNAHSKERRIADPSFSLRGHVLLGIATAVLLVVGCGSWAAYARLEGAILGQGVLKVIDNLKEVQHRDGGIVQHIHARHGDHVEKDQVVVRLDDVQIRAELSIVLSQLGELLGRQARLIAERDNLNAVDFPTQLWTVAADPELVVSGERRLFEGNLLARDSQKKQLLFSIDQTGEELNGLSWRKKSKTEEISAVEAEKFKLDGLFSKGLVHGQRVHAINVDWIRLRGELGEVDATIARANVRISDARLQILAIDQNARTEAQRELRQVEAKLAELNDRRIAAEDRLTRVDIRAPIAGTVNETTVYTIGGVITPAAKIMTIVPDRATLRVEVRFNPVDIDQIRIGQKARLRFSSFNRNTTPELSGLLVHVSPSVTRDSATGALHYVGEIEFTDDIVKLGDRKPLPGMPAEVFVTTDERTPLSYITKPFSDQIQRAFRER
ncbi:MAG: HlyD family type I secretion periplasmic adaptor subunit [Xanthobacteraceae bacterium]